MSEIDAFLIRILNRNERWNFYSYMGLKSMLFLLRFLTEREC